MKSKHISNSKILSELQLDSPTQKEYTKKLKHYIYINELDDLKEGSFLRYISMENDFSLSKPCIYCDVKITVDGMQLFCKSFWGHKYFYVHLDKNLVFRKLQADEKILMAAMKNQHIY